jgi:hypothetical protein
MKLMMKKLQNSAKETRKMLRKFYYDYGALLVFGVALSAVVILSYCLSRLIPADVFEDTISPILHTAILLAAAVGAIAVHRHTYDISARRSFVRAMIWWAVLELTLMLLDKVFGIPTLINDVRNITPLDMAIRNVFAILLIAYPMEVLYPKWLNWWRGILLAMPAFVLWVLDEWTEIDLRILMIIYPLILSGILISQIRLYRARCEDYYSSVENSAMRWIDIYLIMLIIIGMSYFYMCFSNHATMACVGNHCIQHPANRVAPQALAGDQRPGGGSGARGAGHARDGVARQTGGMDGREEALSEQGFLSGAADGGAADEPHVPL